MACAAGPDVSESGLVLALDAGNSKGFDANENLLTYSKDFSAGWSSSLTVTLNNATAPDGTLTAAKYKDQLIVVIVLFSITRHYQLILIIAIVLL